MILRSDPGRVPRQVSGQLLASGTEVSRWNFDINEHPRELHQGGSSGQRPDTKRPDTIRCDGRERDGTGGGSKKWCNHPPGGTLHKTSSESNSSQSAVVHEGQRAARAESTVCGGASPEGAGHVVNTRWVEIGGGAGARWCSVFFLCESKPPSSVSQSLP
jgi:hypothetical protein